MLLREKERKEAQGFWNSGTPPLVPAWTKILKEGHRWGATFSVAGGDVQVSDILAVGTFSIIMPKGGLTKRTPESSSSTM